jgi:hypothetical protein
MTLSAPRITSSSSSAKTMMVTMTMTMAMMMVTMMMTKGYLFPNDRNRAVKVERLVFVG